jgi:hypothetical protein
MPQLALAGTIGVYVILALLLLSLNIFSLWRWWVKAGAIIVTTACFVVAYFTITWMMGWPTFTPLPERFSVVATHVVEPNKLSGDTGHVYLWVEELNELNVPVTAPRGYELPYTPKVAEDTGEAQAMLDSGKKVLGEKKKPKQEPSGQPPQQGAVADNNAQVGRLSGNQKNSGASGLTAIEQVRDAATIQFSEMPAVVLPDKVDEPEPPAGG